MINMSKGWKGESKRHSLASKGIVSGRKQRTPVKTLKRTGLKNKVEKDPYEMPGMVYYLPKEDKFVQYRDTKGNYAYFGPASTSYNDAKESLTITKEVESKDDMRRRKYLEAIGMEGELRPDALRKTEIAVNKDTSDGYWMSERERKRLIEEGDLIPIDVEGEASDIHKVPNIKFDEEGYKTNNDFTFRDIDTIYEDDAYHTDEDSLHESKQIPITESEWDYNYKKDYFYRDVGDCRDAKTKHEAEDMTRRTVRNFDEKLREEEDYIP